MPTELGVRTIEHVPDTRLQLNAWARFEASLRPSEDGPLKTTAPIGMMYGVTVSLTVTVQVVDEPTKTVDGEQTMVVELGS